MSEPTGPSSEAGAANGQLAQHVDRDSDAPLHLAPSPDPWFEPSPQRRASQADGGMALAAGGDTHQAEWFLPTGRAGLLPDSMTESWEETGHPHNRPETAAKPPWAGERPVAGADAPPPWESGPWPGPGEARPDPQPDPAGAADQAAAGRPPAETGNWQARAAVAAGILPVVVPGVVLGVLGLRRSAVTGTGRMWSWIGIGLSVIWAVILIVLVTGGGGSGVACGSYQHPVSVVLRDLAAGAPETVLAQDLQQAISQANAAAAAEQQVAARDAMVSLTSGLQEALTAAAADHSAASYALIRKQLSADTAAVSSACAG